MPQFKFVNKKYIQRRSSELFRDKVVQNFVEIWRFEICRSKKNWRLAHLRNLLICEHRQKSATKWKCGQFKWVLKLQKYSCLDNSMVENLLVFDIIARHFLPIAHTNHYMSIW